MATEVENKTTVTATEEKQEDAPAVLTVTESNVETATTESVAVTEGAESSDAPAAVVAVVKEPAPKKPTVHRVNYEKDVIYLFQFSRTPLLPSVSPYCLKVETWLRLVGLKYENVDHKIKLRSKKGQLPFIELNGQEIADSAIIIKELSQKFEKDLDVALSQEQRNIAHAMISMIENHLTWCIVYWRAKNPEQMLKGFKINLQHALGSKLPNSLLNFFFKIHYGRKGSKKVKAQGMGLHKAEEIEEFGKNDLKVLSEILADKPFFFGDEPTTLDCVAFSVLSQIHYISDEVKYGLKEFMAEQCSNLVGHVSRIKERCFPDWDEICTNLDLNAHLPKPEPEVKENKEGADTEKAAEQDKNESEKELAKDKVEEKAEKIEENKEKEAAAQ